MTNEEIQQLRAYAVATGREDKFVLLKEDADGRYIEYAFKEGAPHDNRCLSWYDKMQPNALRRNHHDQESWKIHETGEIYHLCQMSCGHEDEEGDEHCSPGHPCVLCSKTHCKHWTYEEPVKCACWLLERVSIKDLKINLEQAVKFSEIYCNTQTIK